LQRIIYSSWGKKAEQARLYVSTLWGNRLQRGAARWSLRLFRRGVYEWSRAGMNAAMAGRRLRDALSRIAIRRAPAILTIS
jgi:hypothetical protein